MGKPTRFAFGAPLTFGSFKVLAQLELVTGLVSTALLGVVFARQRLLYVDFFDVKRPFMLIDVPTTMPFQKLFLFLRLDRMIEPLSGRIGSSSVVREETLELGLMSTGLLYHVKACQGQKGKRL